ncbi:hypothetical protein D7Z26_16215 [Cohnella endophytica]|uniref:Spore coat protein n=1 Tax=Cohnella endophytica TaxID=2419778 RepID=A0A494XT95_9BACL|nr:hypothetical protein [Cohnella endophytica]RKP51344.1 hypothetical protein D7Z26_16215 [Cohnella endophytica]
MFKWVSWVIRMGATALLLSFLCIWTTGYIVNSYMESVVKQLDLPLDVQPIALSGIWGTLWGAHPAPKAKNAAESNKPSEEVSPTSSHEADPIASDDSEPSDLPVSGEPNSPTSASPGPGSGTGEPEADPVFNGSGQNQGSGAAQLTDDQRQQLYATVVSKLNPEQLQQLSEALKGGLSQEKLTKVQTMLKSALSEEEYAQMMEVLQGGRKTDASTAPE